MNRKQRRETLVPTRIHTKFLYQEHDKLPVEIKEENDGRTIAIIPLEGYASTKVKDGSWDVVKPEGIDLSRFESGNAPLKAMHWRGVLSNVGVILEAKKDNDWLYIKAEARLDITKDNNWRPINDHDYVLYDRLMNRTINGFSIWFHNIIEEFKREIGANVITNMTLHEVSIVDVPDNPMTIIKMLKVLHENEGDLLDSKATMDVKKQALDEEQKQVKGEETTEEDTEQWTEATESENKDETKTQEENEKDLMGEDSLDDMLKDAVKEQLGVEKWVYVVDIFKSEFVYNLYYQEWNDDWVDKYYRNSYTNSDWSVTIGESPAEVESKRYRVDKSKFLKSIEEESQDSEDSWNATTKTEPENGEWGEEGSEKSLETKSSELEEKVLEVEALTKQLGDANEELEATKGMLTEAQEIAKWALDQCKALKESMGDEIKELKKAKQEHWLSLTGETNSEKSGNVQKALKQGFKELLA